MYRLTRSVWAAKPLSHMFRKLKLAGAHPDILWSIDAQKAQHNGEEMIRLETLMHEREQQKRVGGSSSSLSFSATIKDNAPAHFLFWMKLNNNNNNNNTNNSATLRAVQCTITPLSNARIVKQQLTDLFDQAGILEEFELSNVNDNDGNNAASLESVLRYAGSQQSEHIQQSGSLYVRGDKAVENMRRFGILLVVEEDGFSYLVTLPEGTHYGADTSGASSYSARTHGDGRAPYTPAKSIMGPNGEVDQDVQTFMSERGLRPFDLRMAGSHSSVERFVIAFERLERMYDIHRGRALRSGVCLVLSLRAPDNYVAPDGSIVLSMQRMPAWEEFMLSLPQPTWMDCVAKHKDWRIGGAPKLQERRRRLLRIADMFNFWQVTMETSVGAPLHWQDDLIARFLKEETMIRKTIAKYNVKSHFLKNRGELRFVEHLYSTAGIVPSDNSTSENNNNNNNNSKDGGAARRREIGFRIGGDGVITINQGSMSTGQILRVLRDNLKRVEQFQRAHDNSVKTLEHLSRSVPVDFSVDTEWKQSEEGNLANCLDTFVKTIKQNESQLALFLNTLLHVNSNSSKHGSGSKLPMKRMTWIVSNKFDTLPSGVVFVPYDVDFESIRKLLLARA